MSIPSMPLFCGDYLKDTTELTLEEHGAYLMILMITWAQGGKPLPDDPARMATRLRITKERWLKKIRPVLAPLFDLSDGTWRNARLEREWEYVQQKIAAQRENGAMGGRPRKGAPGNGPNSGASSHCNIPQDRDTNSLNGHETTKPNGFDRRNPNETTHPPSSSADAVEEDEDAGARVAEVVERVAAMIDLPGNREACRATVTGWLKEGADPDIDIFPVVADVLNRTKQVRIRTFGYFTEEITNSRRARLEPKGDKSNVEHIRKSRKPDAGERNAAILGPLARAYQRRRVDAGPAGTG